MGTEDCGIAPGSRDLQHISYLHKRGSQNPTADAVNTSVVAGAALFCALCSYRIS